MKRIIGIGMLLLIVAFGCKKESNPSKSIYGTWELRQEVGGIAGINKHYPQNNGFIAVFNTDNTYSYRKQSAEVSHGTFRIVKNAITMGTLKYDGIFYDNNQTGDIVEVKADTLSIGANYNDGIASIYVRTR